MYTLSNRWKSWVGCCVCVLALAGCDVEIESPLVGEAMAGEAVEGDAEQDEADEEESFDFRTTLNRALQRGDFEKDSWLGRLVQAQFRQAEIEVRWLTEMVMMYYVTNGELPEKLEALTEGRATALTDEIPKDPWGNEYVYEVEEGQRDYEIFSKGPDGKAGTDDDIVVE